MTEARQRLIRTTGCGTASVSFASPPPYTGVVTYRLKLYHGSKLTSAEEIEASLEEAKQLATAAIANGQAHRAELVNTAGSVIFQRWAVL